MRAHDNNRAETVLALFLDAANEYGVPSRLRGDRGSENTQVAVCMIILRGPNRGSIIWGRLVHLLTVTFRC